MQVHQEEVRLNMDIALGRAPELDEDEMQAHLRHKALEVLEETREHNKTGLANLCQDSLMASVRCPPPLFIPPFFPLTNRGKCKLCV
jgi:hypothetical protein